MTVHFVCHIFPSTFLWPTLRLLAVHSLRVLRDIARRGGVVLGPEGIKRRGAFGRAQIDCINSGEVINLLTDGYVIYGAIKFRDFCNYPLMKAYRGLHCRIKEGGESKLSWID